MEINKASGFVIRKMDFSANDEIVTILTSDDIFTFVALGTRKLKSKNRVALQIGNCIEIDFFKARLTNKLSKLKKAVTLIQPPLLTSNNAETIFEIYRLISRMKVPSAIVFNALIDCYSYFGADYNDYIKTFIYFAYLDSIGLYPVNNMCVECGRPDRINDFEFYKGGFLCVLHSEGQRPLEELKAIQNLSSEFLDYSKTSQIINKELANEIKNFISENTFD